MIQHDSSELSIQRVALLGPTIYRLSQELTLVLYNIWTALFSSWRILGPQAKVSQESLNIPTYQHLIPITLILE